MERKEEKKNGQEGADKGKETQEKEPLRVLNNWGGSCYLGRLLYVLREQKRDKGKQEKGQKEKQKKK